MNKKRIIIYVIVALTMVAVLLASKLPSEESAQDDALTVQTESIDDQIEDLDSDQTITTSPED